MTGCISIWVKNLANVANVAGWVRRKGTTLGAVFLLVGQVYISLSLVFFFFYLSPSFPPSTDLCVRVPLRPSFCTANAAVRHTHESVAKTFLAKKYFRT